MRRIIPNGRGFLSRLTCTKRWEGAAVTGTVRHDGSWPLFEVGRLRTGVREGRDGGAAGPGAPRLGNTAQMGSGADRAVRVSRPPRLRVDGPGLPGTFGRRPA